MGFSPRLEAKLGSPSEMLDSPLPAILDLTAIKIRFRFYRYGRGYGQNTGILAYKNVFEIFDRVRKSQDSDEEILTFESASRKHGKLYFEVIRSF